MKKISTIILSILFLIILSVNANALEKKDFLEVPSNIEINEFIFIDEENYIAVGRSTKGQLEGVVIWGNMNGVFGIEYYDEVSEFSNIEYANGKILIVGTKADLTSDKSKNNLIIAYGDKTSITTIEEYGGLYQAIVPTNVTFDEQGNFVVVGWCDNQYEIWNGFIVIGKHGQKDITYLDIDYGFNRGDYLYNVHFVDATHFVAVGQTNTGNGRKVFLVEGDLTGKYEMDVVGNDGEDYIISISKVNESGELIMVGYSMLQNDERIESQWFYHGGVFEVFYGVSDYTERWSLYSFESNYVRSFYDGEYIHIYEGLIDERLSFIDQYLETKNNNSSSNQYLWVNSVDVRGDYYLVALGNGEVLYGRFGEVSLVIEDLQIDTAVFGKNTTEIITKSYEGRLHYSLVTIETAQFTYQGKTTTVLVGHSIALYIPTGSTKMDDVIGWKITDADGERTISLEEAQKGIVIKSDTVVENVYKKENAYWGLWLGLGSVALIGGAFVLNGSMKKKRSKEI